MCDNRIYGIHLNDLTKSTKLPFKKWQWHDSAFAFHHIPPKVVDGEVCVCVQIDSSGGEKWEVASKEGLVWDECLEQFIHKDWTKQQIRALRRLPQVVDFRGIIHFNAVRKRYMKQIKKDMKDGYMEEWYVECYKDLD